MKEEEFIRRYGKEAYEKMRQQSRERMKLWAAANPDEVRRNSQEQCRSGGKYYEKGRQYKMTGIQHEKDLIRQKHLRIWTPFKQIIAPDSVLHHEWLPETANYRGAALVEKKQHQYGYIDVIQILEGEITLLTEAEIRRDGVK